MRVTISLSVSAMALALCLPIHPAEAREDCQAIRTGGNCLGDTCEQRKRAAAACEARNQAEISRRDDPNGRGPQATGIVPPTVQNNNDLRAVGKAAQARYQPAQRPRRAPRPATEAVAGPPSIAGACNLYSSCNK